MTYGARVGYLVAIIVGLSTAAGCGSSLATSTTADGAPTDDAATGGGSCSANVPKGQACNALTNVGASVTPNCVTGTVPTGAGGTILDGTYTLTAQTYYNVTACPSQTVSATVVIAGGCIQEVTSSLISATASGTYTLAGATLMSTDTCLDLGTDAGVTHDAGPPTFTATPTTLTLFIKNSGTTSPNPDRTEAYQKR